VKASRAHTRSQSKKLTATIGMMISFFIVVWSPVRRVASCQTQSSCSPRRVHGRRECVAHLQHKAERGDRADAGDLLEALRGGFYYVGVWQGAAQGRFELGSGDMDVSVGGVPPGVKLTRSIQAVL